MGPPRNNHRQLFFLEELYQGIEVLIARGVLLGCHMGTRASHKVCIDLVQLSGEASSYLPVPLQSIGRRLWADRAYTV